jgi:hypothetical protein
MNREQEQRGRGERDNSNMVVSSWRAGEQSEIADESKKGNGKRDQRDARKKSHQEVFVDINPELGGQY